MHERLAHVDALVIRAVLGASLLAHRLENLGELQQAAPHFGEHVGAALERDARRHLDEDDEVTFIELRQELAAQPRAGDDG